MISSKSIRAKLKNIADDNHILFTSEFANDKNRTKAWSAFLRKIDVEDSISFPHVMNIINVILYPIWNQLKEKTK